MGSFFTCKSCKINGYLQQQKEELQFPQSIHCNSCGNDNSHQTYEVKQERYDFSCSFCYNPFFIRRNTPINVHCPHCSSSLNVNYEGQIIILQQGERPESRTNDSLIGAIGGLILGGAIGGGAGAVAGAILGASLGSRGSQEAIY